jgi:hypothetical protein
MKFKGKNPEISELAWRDLAKPVSRLTSNLSSLNTCVGHHCKSEPGTPSKHDVCAQVTMRVLNIIKVEDQLLWTELCTQTTISKCWLDSHSVLCHGYQVSQSRVGFLLLLQSALPRETLLQRLGEAWTHRNHCQNIHSLTLQALSSRINLWLKKES